MVTATLTRCPVASRDVWTATWADLGGNDQGDAVQMAGAPDRSVQFSGTFAGGTAVLEGSNDGVDWVVLTDPQGNAITATSKKISQISEITQFVRPSTSGGTGSQIKAVLLLRGMAR